MELSQLNQVIEAKMEAAGVVGPTIAAFLRSVNQVVSGKRGLLPEATLEPISSLPRFTEAGPSNGEAESCLRELAVIKLNGGLGTGMGLDGPKSLIPVKGDLCFLDFIARQVLYLRARTGGNRPGFYLMNSFATREQTLAYLRRYPELEGNEPLDFLQSKVPKIDAKTFLPVSWPSDPGLEWCPPGHGDLYPALLSSGLLGRLRADGVRYLFVSNSDNLGATVDPRLLRYFADSGFAFLMEVAERTAADRKGGHLARNRESGRLVLREGAQCPKEDEAAFQDTERHRYFNTNNLWIRLDELERELQRNDGVLPLPLITNSKTVDPKDSSSPKVLQLESAMGAAIECFEWSGAIVVPRTRFSPVKTNGDLLALRSDAYRVTDDFRLTLDEARQGQPPLIELDPAYYRVLADFDRFFPAIPSLRDCRSLKVAGPIQFAEGVTCIGTVEFVNRGETPQTVEAGTFRDQVLRW